MILYDCMHTQDYPVVHVNPTETRKSQIHEVYNLWHNGVPFLTSLWIKQYSTQLFNGVSVIPTCCFTARSDNCNAKDWKLCKPFAFKVHGSAAEPCGIFFVSVGMEVIGIDFFLIERWLEHLHISSIMKDSKDLFEKINRSTTRRKQTDNISGNGCIEPGCRHPEGWGGGLVGICKHFRFAIQFFLVETYVVQLSIY